MNLKKALKHDVEVAGKAIPTMLIAALFLVGGGSAALLTSFGTVSGTADVDQAIEVGNSPGEADLDYTFSNVVGGDTVVNTYDVTNNMDEAYELSYTSAITKQTDSDSNVSYASNTGNVVEWADSEGGITTTYGQKFDAGHDFSGYSVPNSATEISSPSDIDGSGTYVLTSDQNSGFAISTPDVKLYAAEDGVKVDGTVTIDADNVTIKGFEITGGSESRNGLNQGVFVTSTVEDVVIESNEVHGVTGSERATGIKLYGQTGTLSDVVARNNYVYNIKTTSLDETDKEEKAKGIAISGDVQNAEVTQNTIQDVGDSEAAMSNGVDINTGSDGATVPQNFVITYNKISDIDHAENHDHSGDGDPYTYTAGGVYVTGYNTEGNSYGDSHRISYNNFLLSETEATTDVKTWDNSKAGTLNAEDNYWGQDGIQYEVSDTVYTENSANQEVEATWDNTVDAGETAEIAVISDFPLYIDGSYSYHLKTSIR